MYVLIEDKAFKLVTEKTRVKALLNAYKELKLNVIRKCITVMSRPIQVTESSSCQCVLGGEPELRSFKILMLFLRGYCSNDVHFRLNPKLLVNMILQQVY